MSKKDFPVANIANPLMSSKKLAECLDKFLSDHEVCQKCEGSGEVLKPSKLNEAVEGEPPAKTRVYLTSMPQLEKLREKMTKQDYVSNVTFSQIIKKMAFRAYGITKECKSCEGRGFHTKEKEGGKEKTA